MPTTIDYVQQALQISDTYGITYMEALETIRLYHEIKRGLEE